MFQKYSDYHLLAPACVLFTFSVLVVADVYYYYTRKNFNVRTRVGTWMFWVLGIYSFIYIDDGDIFF